MLPGLFNLSTAASNVFLEMSIPTKVLNSFILYIFNGEERPEYFEPVKTLIMGREP